MRSAFRCLLESFARILRLSGLLARCFPIRWAIVISPGLMVTLSLFFTKAIVTWVQFSVKLPKSKSLPDKINVSRLLYASLSSAFYSRFLVLLLRERASSSKRWMQSVFWWQIWCKSVFIAVNSSCNLNSKDSRKSISMSFIFFPSFVLSYTSWSDWVAMITAF